MGHHLARLRTRFGLGRSAAEGAHLAMMTLQPSALAASKANYLPRCTAYSQQMSTLPVPGGETTPLPQFRRDKVRAEKRFNLHCPSPILPTAHAHRAALGGGCVRAGAARLGGSL
jgi:hypothetical protein